MIDKIINHLTKDVEIRKIVLHADENGSCEKYIEYTSELKEMITYLENLKTDKSTGYRARRERDLKDYKKGKK